MEYEFGGPTFDIDHCKDSDTANYSLVLWRKARTLGRLGGLDAYTGVIIYKFRRTF